MPRTFRSEVRRKVGGMRRGKTVEVNRTRKGGVAVAAGGLVGRERRTCRRCRGFDGAQRWACSGCAAVVAQTGMGLQALRGRVWGGGGGGAGAAAGVASWRGIGAGGSRLSRHAGYRGCGFGAGGARLSRATAAAVSAGTPVFGRALRVHDGLGRRLASGRRRPEQLLTSRRTHTRPPAAPSLSSAGSEPDESVDHFESSLALVV